MKYILSFVKTKSGEEYPDESFDTIILLIAHVNIKYPDFTSYSITVLK